MRHWEVLEKLGCQELLNEVHERFTFFNKPRQSIYRCERFDFQLDELIVAYQERSRWNLGEHPQLMLGSTNLLAPVHEFDRPSVQDRVRRLAIQRPIEAAYLLYPTANQFTAPYFAGTDWVSIWNDYAAIKRPLVEAADSSLEGRLVSAQLARAVELGNCGSCSDVVLAELLRRHYRETGTLLPCECVELTYSAELANEEVFTLIHSFLVVGGGECVFLHANGLAGSPFLENTVFVDAWNGAMIRGDELERPTTPASEYLVFFLRNFPFLDGRSLYASFRPSDQPENLEEALSRDFKVALGDEFLRLHEVAEGARAAYEAAS